jgi:hypothetical protein
MDPGSFYSVTPVAGQAPARRDGMTKWVRRLVLVGALGLGFSTFASACSNPSAPPLPEAEEETDTIPPEDG